MLCFYDSGIGGLSIIRHLIQKNPNLNFTYIADTKFLPLGSKTPTQILERLEEIGEYALSSHDLMIQVCNTASVNTARSLQTNFLPKNFSNQNKQILGISRPILELLSQLDTTKTIKKESQNEIQEKVFDQKKAQIKIGILATPATIRSNFYQIELQKIGFEVVELTADGLAFAIENFDFEECKKILQKLPNQNLDYVLLACTHYSFVSELIVNHFKNSVIIDPSEFIADCILSYIDRHLEYSTKKETSEIWYTGKDYNISKWLKYINYKVSIMHKNI
jgi:glutamate racemase